MVKIKFVNGDPVELPKYSKEGTYYDRKMIEIFDRFKFRQSKNFDNVIILVGDVGVGKTTKAFAGLNYMLGGRMTILNVGVGIEDTLRKIALLPDYSGIVIDDASTIFYGGDHASKHQKQSIKILHLCRSKKLTIFLTTPDLFKMNSYLITQRCRAVVKVYTDKNLNRGYFCFWGYKKIRALYTLGKKYNNNFPMEIKPDFLGRYGNFVPLFNDEYEKLKRKALEEIMGDKEKEYTMKDLKPIHMKMLDNLPKMDKPIQFKQFAQLCNISATSVQRYRQELAEKLAKTQANQPKTESKYII